MVYNSKSPKTQQPSHVPLLFIFTKNPLQLLKKFLKVQQGISKLLYFKLPFNSSSSSSSSHHYKGSLLAFMFYVSRDGITMLPFFLDYYE
ncbi:hypothetical protein CLOM_g10584 [Closterium sp. NIES-68]|nr:hypothetical protein CLOM_g10584 [Closterium sp. NIES-68]GJP78824.1 hypothetical protein CLOP_g9092 [Closterium sp. NIES-67]